MESRRSADRAKVEPPLVVRGPGALAAALPYLLDGPSAGCVVLAVLSRRGRLRTLAHRRMPGLPPAASEEALAGWAGRVAALLAEGLGALDLRADEYAAVVLYLPTGAARLPAVLGERLLRGLGDGPQPRLLDVIAVFDGRWRSLVCAEEACCPADGRDLLEDPAAVEVQVALIAAAEARLAIRDEPSGPGAAEVAAAAAGEPYPRTFTARRALLRRVWPTVKAPTAPLSAEAIAALLAAAERPGVRDALLARMARVAERRPGWWEQQFRLWREVAAVAPGPLLAGPACIAAVSAWALLDTRAALILLARALAEEPQHRMSVLLRRLIEQGGSAGEWFVRVRALDEADCLRFDRPPGAGRRHAAG